ncbi:MAG: Mov34/MPN/PAD-1 family protein, partial [Candidatus Odinarchaeota archaeon]|nr:Mov34/MPN/PAD-1 family protein [Candidatus Odinarchaeota archaeon]
MRKHARKNKSKEVCGIIIGDVYVSQEIYTTTELFLTKNIIKSNIEFEIDPYELYKIYLRTDEIGKEIISISHSHPSGTTPSSTDLTFMRVNPYIWLIFDMESLEYAGYFLDSSKNQLVKKEKLEIIHGHYAIPHATSLYLLKEMISIARVITTLHGSDVHLLGLDDAYKPVMELSLNRHDAITTVSKFMKKFTKELYDINKRRNSCYLQ